MASKVTADPDARTITIIQAPINDVVVLDVVEDIYSGLKDDWLSDATLQPLRFPFRTFGDDTGSGQIGPYVFFDNVSGWRLVPFDADHEVELVGNLIPESAIQGLTLPLWKPQPGRTIPTREKVSAQALTREVRAAVTAQEKTEIAGLVWDEATGDHTAAGTLGKSLLDVKNATHAPTLVRGEEFGLAFAMLDDNGDLATGLTVTAMISKDGGTLVAATNSVTEIGGGLYFLILTDAEMTVDMAILVFTATGARPQAVSLSMYKEAVA